MHTVADQKRSDCLMLAARWAEINAITHKLNMHCQKDPPGVVFGIMAAKTGHVTETHSELYIYDPRARWRVVTVCSHVHVAVEREAGMGDLQRTMHWLYDEQMDTWHKDGQGCRGPNTPRE